MQRTELKTSAPRKPKVLVVDDFPTNVAILEELLSDDFEVKSARSGEEALEILTWYRPDIMLLDIMMPGIDGYEVCRRVRKLEDCRYTKIVIVSAKAALQERFQGYEAGADDYLVKPFDSEELLSKIRAHLRLKAAEEVDALKNQILSLLSNDACTPLRGILAPAEILRSADHLPGDARQRLGELIYKSAVQLEEYFRAAVTLCALRSGKKKLRSQLEDLSDLVRSVVEGSRAKASVRSLTFSENYGVDLLVFADKEALAEVFADLIDRAIVSSEEGGSVSVSTWCEEREVYAAISDKGRPIPKERLPRIFEIPRPDECVEHEGREEQSPRSALALPLAREVILAHGGRIDVRSEGKGTTFTVVLPRVADYS